jgi:hypothetical protein
MLKNPSFEDPFVMVGAPEVKVAEGWKPFFLEGNAKWRPDLAFEESQNPCARPEYKPLYASQFPYRVLDGAASQCWFAKDRVFLAGVYQRVDVAVGATYEFKIYIQAWYSRADDPRKSEGEMYAKLGVDLNGGEDGFSAAVNYSPVWEWVSADFVPLVYRFVATGPKATLFLMTWPKWKLRHNDVIVDKASLVRVGGEPGPEPSPEPSPDLAELKAWIAVTSAEAWAAAAEAAVSVWKRAMEDMVGDRALAGRAHPSPRRGLWAWLAHLLCK